MDGEVKNVQPLAGAGIKGSKPSSGPALASPAVNHSIVSVTSTNVELVRRIARLFGPLLRAAKRGNIIRCKQALGVCPAELQIRGQLA